LIKLLTFLVLVTLITSFSGCDEQREFPYKIPPLYLDESSPDSVQAMKADWKTGNILESRMISVLGKSQCVDILRDATETKLGFIQFNHPDEFRHFWISTEQYEAFGFEKDLVFVILKNPQVVDLPLCNKTTNDQSSQERPE